jgi:hypothetical protein
MADSRADQILSEHARMTTQRQTFDDHRREIAERVIPRKNEFKRGGTAPDINKGEKRTEKMFDSTPALALDRFAAAVQSLVSPTGQQWHKLKASDEDLRENLGVQRYLDELNKRLFAARYAANFAPQTSECYYDLGWAGNMALFIGDRLGRGLYYDSIGVDESFFAENEYGVIDKFHREHWLTARQAAREFGLNKLPAAIKNAAERHPEQEFKFIRCYKPNQDLKAERRDYRGMQFASYVLAADFRDIVSEGGYRTFPVAVSRYSVSAGEVYGRSPCMTVLPDIKMLNEMERTTIQAAQLATLPPLLAHKDGILDAFRMTPAAMNYGGIDDNGRQLVQPMQFGSRIEIGIEMRDQKRLIVREALWNTLFQILVENPQMTATEALIRAQEKGALLAPPAARIESEFLSPTIEREIDILSAAGRLPEMPAELLERGGIYAIEFENPLALARRSNEGVAILRSFEQLATMAQVVGPEKAFKRINMDEATKILLEVNGFPSKAIYSDDEVEEINEAQAAQAQAAQVLQAAPVAASAAKDLAQAGAIASTAEGQAAPQVVPA